MDQLFVANHVFKVLFRGLQLMISSVAQVDLHASLALGHVAQPTGARYGGLAN